MMNVIVKYILIIVTTCCFSYTVLGESNLTLDEMQQDKLTINLEKSINFLHDSVAKIILDTNLIKTKNTIEFSVRQSEVFQEYYILYSNKQFSEGKLNQKAISECSLFLVSVHFNLLKQSLKKLEVCNKNDCKKKYIDKEQSKLFIITDKLEHLLVDCIDKERRD